MTAENIETSEQDENPQNSHGEQEPHEITAILEFLSDNDKIIFKSQQIDDPELQRGEKIALAREIYLRNRQTFLQRFGAYMEETHLQAFAQTAICEGVSPPLHKYENYDEMQFLLLSYQRKLHTRQQDVKNRRYAAMRQMMSEGEYFGEQEMMNRSPELYHELIGQYLTEEEKKSRDSYDVRNTTFSGILMHTLEQRELQDVMKRAQTEIETETDQGDLDNDNNDEDLSPAPQPEPEQEENFGHQWGNFDNEKVVCIAKAEKVVKKCKKVAKSKPDTLISAGERQLLREEFMGIMQQQFLAGKDTDFDYSAVDDDSKLDDLQQLNRDKEDAYFDDTDDEEHVIEKSATKESSEESDDDLDIFMTHLNRHHSLQANG